MSSCTFRLPRSSGPWAGLWTCLWLILLFCVAGCVVGCNPRKHAATQSGTEPPGLLPGNASALDYLDLLGLTDQILALPRTVDGYSDFLNRHPEARTLPRLADFKAESILALRPAVVITDATQSPETRDYLLRAGIKVLVLAPFRNLDDGAANLRLIAKAVELDPEVVIQKLRKSEQVLRSQVDKKAKAPRVLPWVFYGEGHWTAGQGTGADYALSLAGARNRAAQLGLRGHQEIPIEVLLDSDPDAVLISDKAMAVRLREHPRLKELRCIKAGKIILLDASLASCNSPYLIDAASEIRRQLVALGLLER